MNYYMMVTQFIKKTVDRAPLVEEYAAEIESQEGRQKIKVKTTLWLDKESVKRPGTDTKQSLIPGKLFLLKCFYCYFDSFATV